MVTERKRYKVRVHPQLCQAADGLRDAYYYHAPDGPFPSRRHIVEVALRKGLRELEWLLMHHQLHTTMLPPVVTSEYIKVSVRRQLLEFSDRLRGRLYELQRGYDTAGVYYHVYPSRSKLICLALDLGLREVESIYAVPTIGTAQPEGLTNAQ